MKVKSTRRGPTGLLTLVLAPLGAVCLLSSDGLAFKTQGHRWPNQASQPVSYRIQPDGSRDITDGTDVEAIRHAFSTWQSVACSYLTFHEDTWQDPKAVANDGLDRIFFIEQDGQWTGQAATIGLTFTFYRTQDNQITDADMALNGVNWHFTTNDADIGTGTPAKIDLETVVFHEAGHFIGLDHSTDPAAAMYPSNNKPKQRGPALDDVRGVCSLYSNGMPVPDDPMQTGTGSVFGAPCSKATDCASNRCVSDTAANRTYCTMQCDPSATTPCPAGYFCTPAQDGNYCIAPAIVDEICDPCDDGTQCTSGFCTTVTSVNSDRPFCSRPCDPTPGQPTQCPDGYSCRAVIGAAGGACAPNTGICSPAGRGGQDESCYVNGTCKAGFSCVEYYPNSGLNFCYYSCAAEYAGQSCTLAGGTRCDPVANRDNAFVCFSVAGEGQPCIPEICDPTSFCAYDENLGVDSATCYRMCNGTTDCGPQSQCQAFPGLPNLCIPLQGFKYEGEACTADAECRSHTCRTYGDNRLCTSACATTDPHGCGAGFTCVPQAGSTQGLCWPEATLASHGGTHVNPGFCSCDTTNGCDANCPCDPECSKGGGCSCAALEAPVANGPSAAFAVVFGLLMCGLRLARRRVWSGALAASSVRSRGER